MWPYAWDFKEFFQKCFTLPNLVKMGQYVNNLEVINKKGKYSKVKFFPQISDYLYTSINVYTLPFPLSFPFLVLNSHVPPPADISGSKWKIKVAVCNLQQQ
jgi:hypothetical protein